MTNLVLHCTGKRTGGLKRLNSDLDLKSFLKYVAKKLLKNVNNKEKIAQVRILKIHLKVSYR